MDWTGTRGAWRGLRTAGKCLHPCLLFGTKVSKAMLGLESQSSVWDDQDIAERMRATSGVRLGERYSMSANASSHSPGLAADSACST